MSTIRVMYSVEPNFPATDQHPDAVRYHITVDGREWWIDALGGEPSADEVRAVLAP